MKKQSSRAEFYILMTICLVFLLAGLGIGVSVKNYVPPEGEIASGLRYGREDYRRELVRLIREEEANLRRMMEVAEALPPDTFLDRDAAARTDPSLAQWMEDCGVVRLVRDEKMWIFETKYTGGIVTSSVYYRILHTPDDPRMLVTTWNDDTVPWTQHDGGWVQSGSNIAYLEEISDDFYYFYLAT